MDDIPPCTSALGTGGRVFESLRSDHQFNPAFAGFFCFQVESRCAPIVVKSFYHDIALTKQSTGTKKGPKQGPVNVILIKKIKKSFLIMHNYS